MSRLPCVPDVWSRFSALLDGAMDMPPSEHASWLERLSGEDAGLPLASSSARVVIGADRRNKSFLLLFFKKEVLPSSLRGDLDAGHEWMQFGLPNGADTLGVRERRARFLLDHNGPDAASTECHDILRAAAGSTSAPATLAARALAAAQICDAPASARLARATAIVAKTN